MCLVGRLQEFAKSQNFYQFTGLPPTEAVTAQSQKNEFMRQLGEQFGFSGLKADDWGTLFSLLAKNISGEKKRTIILFDEISWMGSKDPEFLGKLKIAWDLYFENTPRLILIFCSSISTWIENNIIKSTGFFGRIATKITLKELSLTECNTFIENINFNGSTFEKFMLLSICGGVPRYLELINPQLSANENIKQLCFSPDGIFVDEFKQIFHDLFGKRGQVYQNIVEYLANGPAEYKQISQGIKYPSSGPLSEYLDALVISDFLELAQNWSFTSGKTSRLRQYRLKDNYLRFYLKYILPNLNKINHNQFLDISITSLLGWESIIGLQFENLVLNNRNLVHKALGVNPADIICDNPFFQRKTKRKPGCQIDYLIQTKQNSVYICEIKFSKNPIKPTIIPEVKQKIASLKLSKNFAKIPVLININGVSNDVISANYFGTIINFSEFFKV